MMPDLTIVIPTTDGRALWLPHAIDSALMQTHQDIEIIVVDNSRSLKANDIVASYNDKRLKYIPKEPGGMANSLNVGFGSANGRFFSWLADDDRLLPEFAERVLFHVKEVDLVYASFYFVEVKDGIVVLTKSGKVIDHPWGGYDKLILGNHLGVFFCFKRQTYERIGGFSITACEDYNFVLRCAEENMKIQYVPEVLGMYFVHAGQASKTTNIIDATNKIQNLSKERKNEQSRNGNAPKPQ